MGLFRRWFEGSEGKSGEALEGLTAPDTLEQHGHRSAVSDERARSDGEQGEDSQMRVKVQYLLETAINPAVAGHGGVVSLVDVKDRMELPEVVDIIDVTDHAAGENPYSGASKK